MTRAEDEALLKESDKKYTAFQRFLCGIYAKRIGIDTISLAIDPEIMQFEQAMNEYDLQQSMDEGQRLMEQYKKMRTEDA